MLHSSCFGSWYSQSTNRAHTAQLPAETDRKNHVMQKGEAGSCVFGRIVLVMVHHRLADTNHVVFAISRGPYKECPHGGCMSPTFLPGRMCVTWAPDISFKYVEAWWQDVVNRECMQTVRFLNSSNVYSTPEFVLGTK